jgi:hypothetical protein
MQDTPDRSERRTPILALLGSSAVFQLGNVSRSTVAVPWFVLEANGSAARTGLAGVATQRFEPARRHRRNRRG